MGIFTGVPCRGALNDSGVVENGNFQYFLLISSEALQVRPTLLYTVNRGKKVLPVTLNENSNNDVFDNFHCYEQRYSKIILPT